MRTSRARRAELANAGRFALPWLLLMLVSTASARAMQAGIESVGTSAQALSSRSAPRSSAPGPVVQDRSVVVLVSFTDASGNQTEFRCWTTADRVTTDSLSLHLEDLPAVVSDLCDAVRT
jgi:hypothetical protein